VQQDFAAGVYTVKFEYLFMRQMGPNCENQLAFPAFKEIM